MKYDEIRQTITTSSPGDWAVVTVDGWTFLERAGACGHTHLATCRAEVDLRLAWGAQVAEGLDFPGYSFRDPAIERLLVDGFWRGALVTRWTALLVDGGRCYLPEPQAVMAETGEGTFGYEQAGHRVKASEVALATLLQGLEGRPGPGVDVYLQQTGAIVTPGE